MKSRVCLKTYSSHHICDSSEICLLVVELEIFFPRSVARRLKTKEKQKRRKAYEPKLTPEGKPFHLFLNLLTFAACPPSG